MNYPERTIIVTAQWQSLAQTLCAAIAEGAAGENMFTTGLSASGTSPATHYISNGPIAQEFADLLPLITYDEDEIETTPGNPAAIAYLADQAGLSVDLEDISAMLGSAHITDAEAIGPFEVMGRKGLKIVQEVE